VSCRFLLLSFAASDLKIKRASRSFVGQVSQISFVKVFFLHRFSYRFLEVFWRPKWSKKGAKIDKNGYFSGSVFGIVF